MYRKLKSLPIILINGIMMLKAVIIILKRYSPFASRPVTIFRRETSSLKNQNSCTIIKGKLKPKSKNANSSIIKYFVSI